MSFSKNLEYLRKSRKMSQEDLAFKLGVSRQAVSKWESGAAYPETEKIVAICKLFDCSLDELLKDDIEELRKDEVRKYTFQDLVKELSSLIKRTADMFNRMDRKTLFRFFFELIVLIIVIFFVVKIPFDYIASLGYDVFFAIGGSVGSVLNAIWRFLVNITYFITSLLLFISIYKAKFLENVDLNKEELAKPEEKETKYNVKEEKRVVRHDFGILSSLEKIFVFCVKVFTAFISVFIIFSMLIAVAGLVIVISWMFEGVFLFSPVIFALSFILLSTIILYIIYNFIVNRRIKWEKVFTFLLISFLSLGISMGVGVIEMKEFTLTSAPDKYVIEDKKEQTFQMSNSLIIGNSGYRNNKYVEDKSMIDSIKVEVSYYGDFRDAEIIKQDNTIFITFKQEDVPLYKMYKMLIRDLKEKEVHVNYGYLSNYDVTVYTSSQNIEKIQENIMQQYNIQY
jgi:transcriptional regulator with XRE-family HTH domain